MRVSQIMNQRLVTVGMDDRLSDVKQIYDNVSFHHLVVVDESNKLVGILTEGDMLSALSPYLGFDSALKRDLQTLNKRVHQVMSRSPISVSPDTPVAQVCKLFSERGFGCVPVVDATEELVGLVTWRDLVKLIPPLLPKA